MKIGMIFECGPDGPDKKVCVALAKKIIPGLEINSKTLDVKPNLIAECGSTATILFEQGCELVFIIWDLYPAWRQNKERPCRHEDKERIDQSLRDAGADVNRVRTICIEEELEAWLLADGRALAKVMHYSGTIKDEKRPERVSNPKKRMNQTFQQKCGRDYVDYVHADKIVEVMPDLKRIRRSNTFMYFARKLTGNPEINF